MYECVCVYVREKEKNDVDHFNFYYQLLIGLCFYNLRPNLWSTNEFLVKFMANGTIQRHSC